MKLPRVWELSFYLGLTIEPFQSLQFQTSKLMKDYTVNNLPWDSLKTWDLQRTGKPLVEIRLLVLCRWNLLFSAIKIDGELPRTWIRFSKEWKSNGSDKLSARSGLRGTLKSKSYRSFGILLQFCSGILSPVVRAVSIKHLWSCCKYFQWDSYWSNRIHRTQGKRQIWSEIPWKKGLKVREDDGRHVWPVLWLLFVHRKLSLIWQHGGKCSKHSDAISFGKQTRQALSCTHRASVTHNFSKATNKDGWNRKHDREKVR